MTLSELEKWIAARPCEETEAKIARRIREILTERGGFDRDELYWFVEGFYDHMAEEGCEFVEPDPVTPEWIQEVAVFLADAFAGWLQAGSLQRVPRVH